MAGQSQAGFPYEAQVETAWNKALETKVEKFHILLSTSPF
jgi:hypothetical protein